MARKEIKFRRSAPGSATMEGRQDGVIYRIHGDRTLLGTASPAYTVSTYDTKEKGRTINTAGHINFHMDGAKEFCQQIAAGEVDLDALRQRFEEETAAKDQAALRAATAEAKAFREKLEAAGISYQKLLGLEAERANLSSIAHNILVGLERGEDLPHG